MKPLLDIQTAADLEESFAATLQASLEQCLVALALVLPDGLSQKLSQEICLRVCSAAESQELNRTYRGKDQPTNVLSFGFMQTDSNANDAPVAASGEVDLPLGDLALCWPVALAEAQQQSKNPGDHLTHLFLHGVLHLLGYDHEDDADAQTMEQIEIQTLASLGISDPYQDPSEGPR